MTVPTCCYRLRTARRRRGTSGQGGLFEDGGAGGDLQAIRLPACMMVGHLTEIMVHERDAFGFYFASHPVSHYARQSPHPTVHAAYAVAM